MTEHITTPAEMREAAARLIYDRCADILSKQDGKIPEVDQGLRLMAVPLPDLAAAIRALPVAEPEPQAVNAVMCAAERDAQSRDAVDLTLFRQAIRAEALREAEKALRDWQDDLNVQRMPDAAITVGMAADVVGEMMEKPTR